MAEAEKEYVLGSSDEEIIRRVANGQYDKNVSVKVKGGGQTQVVVAFPQIKG